MSLAELQNKQTMVYEPEQVSEYNFLLKDYHIVGILMEKRTGNRE